MRGIAWISQDRDTPDVGHNLGQQLEDLAAVVAGDVRDSGQIAARSSQTRHEARPNRIGHANHDDRGCLRHLLGCTAGGVPHAKIRSTLAAMSWLASSGRRSVVPSVHRCSRMRLRPST